MWARKLYIATLSDMKSEMNTSLQIKRLNRLKKGYSENFFALGSNAVDAFFTKLNEHLDEIPNRTRFQVGIVHDPSGHWWMIDCYIKDGVLYTFTMDAGVLNETLIPMLTTLSKNVPFGNHFTFAREENTKGIQVTEEECWIFTRQHISMISKMDPDKLYDMLAANTKTTNLANMRTFTIEALNDDMAMLAPLFRNMQSMERFYNLPPAFKRAIVSNKKVKNDETIIPPQNLSEWVWRNTVTVKRKNKKTNTLENKEQNHGIFKQGYKYLNIFCKSKQKFANDRSGFGFITFPTLTRIREIMVLETIDPEMIRQTTADLILTLMPAAKFTTKAAAFFGYRGMHTNKTKQVIKKLEALIHDKTFYHPDGGLIKSRFLDAFCEIVYEYAGYLDKHHSVRTLQLLKDTFARYEEYYIRQSKKQPHDPTTEFNKVQGIASEMISENRMES